MPQALSLHWRSSLFRAAFDPVGARAELVLEPIVSHPTGLVDGESIGSAECFRIANRHVMEFSPRVPVAAKTGVQLIEPRSEYPI